MALVNEKKIREISWPQNKYIYLDKKANLFLNEEQDRISLTIDHVNCMNWELFNDNKLIWEDHNYCSTNIKNWYIIDYYTDQYLLTIRNYCKNLGHILGIFKTLKEAKQAAQKHYEENN